MGLVAACGDDGDEPATPTPSASAAASVLGPVAPAKGEPVKIGVILEGKSTVSDMSVQDPVVDAAVQWLNEHRSGIEGRPIQVVTCEALGDPGKATDCGNLMVEENVVAAVIGESAVMEPAWRPLHDAKIPVMINGTSDPGILADKDSTFVLLEGTAGTIGLPIQVAKEKGLKKVTGIVIDVPAATALQTNVAPAEYEKAGIEFELIRIPPGTADMTPQLGAVTSGEPSLAFVLGNDAFCISAFNGLRAVGFTGPISAIAQCVTDATRKAVSGDVLDGMEISAATPIGTDNPATQLYKAVIDKYAPSVDTSKAAGMIMFTTIAALQTSLSGITGEITPASVTSTIRAMPESELPAGGGIKFKCDGKASTMSATFCSRGTLVATLDDKGVPETYTAMGTAASG
ncbi:ABC transporter substrate-binding protein [Frankia nepalensis]|uniref:ABC transporter substrate-binding protein n=1 Tax=Frankia nepalensis TaxID=1836974 RepID=UPI0027DD2B9F|nr:ABC transporter substrate-binding protein [Frankia nepalensis]